MSTLLLSCPTLGEPFGSFSSPPDTKEYLHSFSDSLLNYSPPTLAVSELTSGSPGSLGGHLTPHHHHHLASSHHQLLSGHSSSSLSDMVFKCEFDDFHADHHSSSLCSPCLIDEYNVDGENAWMSKPPDQWQPLEVADWIRDWARRNEIADIEVAHLLYNPLTGADLCQMHRDYFTSVCPSYGSLIFDTLQSLLHQFTGTVTHYMGDATSFSSNSHNHNQTHSMQHSANGQQQQQAHLSACLPNDGGVTLLHQQQHHLHQHQHHHENGGSPNGGHVNLSNLTHGGSMGPDGALGSHTLTHQTMDFFPSMGNLDVLSNSLFDTQTAQLNYSPSYTSVSDSDRESTSSNLSGVNERRMHVNAYYTPSYLTGGDLSSGHESPTSRANTNTNTNTTIGIMATKGNGNASLPVSIVNKRNGRRGRPPKKEAKSRSKGNGKLWEFIRDLLLNPVTNPSFIRWERREDGIFKFIQSDKVAKLWGERKQNPRMTYEKLSRAMRYYYKSQVLLPVFGRRLVYKFGPNATGWRAQFDMPGMKHEFAG